MVFEKNKKEGTDELTFDDFKKMVPCKNVDYLDNFAEFQPFNKVKYFICI